MPDKDFGEYREGRRSAEEPPARANDAMAEKLIAWCRRTQHHQDAEVIDFEEELPRHANGKLYKRLLKGPLLRQEKDSRII